MAARTITMIPWSPATLSWPGAGVTKTPAQWGIDDRFSGSFRSLAADDLQLRLAGGALAVSPFPPRSLVKLVIDGKPFFTGTVPDDVDREGQGDRNEGCITILGPWTFLERIIYQMSLQILTAVNNGQPVYANNWYTHFTLNFPIKPTFVGGAGFVTNSITYAGVQWNSQQQIADVLTYAIAAGAYLQFNIADLLNIPVLPSDVLNIHCAEAIQRQLDTVDAVGWFDHTQDPPQFHCQRRANLGQRTVTVPEDARGFKIHELVSRRVPYVVINFEQPLQVGGINTVVTDQQFYPNPLPADQLGALIVTVPLRGISGSTQSKYIQTAPINLNTLAFWQTLFPEMDPDKNPNAGTDFANLAFTAGTAPSRQLNPALYPNMIVAGGWARWMGGYYAEDIVFAQFKYSKSQSANSPGSDYNNHTKCKRIKCTSLNVPDGIFLTTTAFSSIGDFYVNFLGMAQIWWTDLNARQWEGSVPVFEDTYSGENILGTNLNVAGGHVDWATMNILVQSIEFDVRTGGIHYSLRIGPNKAISAQQLADLIRAQRTRYITSVFLTPAPPLAQIELPYQEAYEEGGDSEPQAVQHTTLAPSMDNPALVNTGIVHTPGQGGTIYGDWDQNNHLL